MQILVCALPCEAKPLIEHFKLPIVSNELPFKIYKKNSFILLVTGVGKMACAAACSFLAGKYNIQDAIWLNIGICGGLGAIGTPFLAHKILGSSRPHFPSFVFPLPCLTAILITTEIPQKNIDSDNLYDMEGAGFFETVTRFSSLEFIHCVKILSDHGAKQLEKIEVSHLITKQIPLIETLLQHLKNLQKEEISIHNSQLSHTEQCQCKRLLQQCKALGLSPPTHDLFSLKQFVKSHVPTHLH